MAKVDGGLAEIDRCAGRADIARRVDDSAPTAEPRLDAFEDAGEVTRHVFVADSQHSEARQHEPPFSLLVPFWLRRMHRAVDLHDELRCGTEKVDDESPKPLLSPELRAAESAISGRIPKHRLGRSRASAERAGAMARHGEEAANLTPLR